MSGFDYDLNFKNSQVVKEYYAQRMKTLFWVHVLLEVLYIFLGCTPMIFANIASIVTYYLTPRMLTGDTLVLSQIIVLVEVYVHSCLDCFLIGRESGFQFWLVGIFCSMWIPFMKQLFTPTGEKLFKGFRIIVALTILFLIWPYRIFDIHAMYAPGEVTAAVMLVVNALLGILSISSNSGFYTDILEENNKDLFNLATHDSLTGLYSRQYLLGMLEDAIGKHEKDDKYSICVAIADIDFFKKVNDTYGHIAGDAVLKGVADYLKELEKDGIIAGRYGGEEFLMFASDAESYGAFCDRMQSLNQDIGKHVFESDNTDIHITLSVGAAQFDDISDMESIIKKADDNLYTAKESGRNRVIC